LINLCRFKPCVISVRAADRFKEWRSSDAAASASEVTEQLSQIQRAFNSLKVGDCKLIRLGSEFKDDLVAPAVADSSAARGSPLKVIGALAWVCLRMKPDISKKFPIYMKALYEMDNEPVDEATIKAWHACAAGSPEVDIASYLPAGCDIAAADMAKLRTSCNPLVQWLDAAEEDDDDDDEDEDD
jgi:eIF4-gamma/eIF5/eIF2-epsilon